MQINHTPKPQSITVAPSFWENPLVHPAAEMLPMMSEQEIKELAADIEENGLREPVDVFVDNSEESSDAKGPFPIYLLDGRNRLAALKLLGIENPSALGREMVRVLFPINVEILKGARIIHECNPVTYVLSKNVHRRHLTAEQRREAIAAYIKAKPQTSNRKIAKALKVDGKTVGAVRTETAVPNAEIPQMEHLPIERAKSAVRDNPDASVTKLAAIANVGRATIQRAQHLVKAEGPKPPQTSLVDGPGGGLSHLEKTALAMADEKSTKSRDAAGRKDLTDEVAEDVARTLNQIWQKWCAADPTVDWAMFAAAVRRFLKTSAKVSES